MAWTDIGSPPSGRTLQTVARRLIRVVPSRQKDHDCPIAGEDWTHYHGRSLACTHAIPPGAHGGRRPRHPAGVFFRGTSCFITYVACEDATGLSVRLPSSVLSPCTSCSSNAYVASAFSRSVFKLSSSSFPAASCAAVAERLRNIPRKVW